MIFKIAISLVVLYIILTGWALYRIVLACRRDDG